MKKLGVKPTFGKFAVRGSVALAAKKPGVNVGKKVRVKVSIKLAVWLENERQVTGVLERRGMAEA